ncbi:NAD(P)-dependent oxidoreductase [Novosphingobium album (ex Liu et al. 2023)]|uniref:NAD(P)-dependent oxidoreductase n=1 Tax=Novosphingobium album (ex Liu et al. 2023) TaxID=3031130 RepID=A0ABT5WXB8_9SPHN|nr:NAD(P)-dependent oxidoreductase [Novosphingobium album (ex Liu et al. 2023)]MDE8654537.1 NAD(P)-dependent oxidoreductase [Novosphingobium album (ex Liu et al. 2023)]
MQRIGFIGIGSQGGPMAMRIVDAGMPLVVWARRPEALEPYLAKGASAAASVADLGARCDHVGVCVVDDAGVLAICDELIPAMRPGACLALHSTVLPATVEELERRCTARGIAFVDAPVSGGAPGAEAGTLTVMCGGTQAAFDSAHEVFETFGKLIVLLGPAGAGQRAKIVNNALLAANMGLAQAALQAGETLGVDRAALAALVKESSGRSFGFEVFARLPSPAAFAIGAPLLVKDVGLLGAILPGHDGADLLAHAAHPFLTAATGG